MLVGSSKEACRMFWKASKGREFSMKSFYCTLELEMEVPFP